jgi:hypothetical protein
MDFALAIRSSSIRLDVELLESLELPPDDNDRAPVPFGAAVAGTGAPCGTATVRFMCCFGINAVAGATLTVVKL